MTDDNSIQIYESPDGETCLDVRFEKETAWAFLGLSFVLTGLCLFCRNYIYGDSCPYLFSGLHKTVFSVPGFPLLMACHKQQLNNSTINSLLYPLGLPRQPNPLYPLDNLSGMMVHNHDTWNIEP